MPEPTSQTLRVSLHELRPESGEFEILAITAGEGNGWLFPAEVLQASLSLWDGCECFIDHEWGGHSLRDLAGVCHSPQFDPACQGVRLRLRPFGPSAGLLAALGREMLSGTPAPDVGFSADLIFTAAGQTVAQILRVLSVDLVLDPARGGAFLRLLNSRRQPTAIPQGGNTMQETQANQELLQNDRLAVEVEKARQARTELCGCLLESGLAAANLPAPVAERIRKQFSGRTFEAVELQTAIDDGRKLVSDLTGGWVVQGPGRIHGMASSEDQVSAAVYDLLGADRPEGLKNLRTAKLSGIREMYALMTGDLDFAGGYHPERAQFAATADLPGVLKNALNKLIVQQWEELGRSGYRWWEPVVSVEHFNSLHALTGVLVGEVTVLPEVAEGAAYTELELSDSAESGAWAKYGGYIGLTLEMFERDQTQKLRQYPRKLASASLRRVSALVASVFTANAGTGPLMTDTKNVFDAAHNNLGSTALSSAAWENASKAIYEQPMLVAAGGTAPRLALDARYLLVPRGLRLTAQRILYPAWEREANIVSENLQRGEMGDVITVPEFSDANDWAAVADPRLAPGIIIGERFGLQPEIYLADAQTSGALFTNDELRMKVRHWLSVFVADYRPLFKSNVA